MTNRCDETLSPQRVAALRLALIPGVGPRTYRLLIAALGSAEAVLDANRSQLQSIAGVGPKLSRQIADAKEQIDVEAEIDRCRRNGVTILFDDDQGYPQLLLEIDDPPVAMFMRGQLQRGDALSLAIVGSRHASSYGVAQARRLAAGLAHAGFTIISGLARGIDAAAHRGALQAGGRTVAVLGSGVLNIYPADHVELADQIVHQGALLSEAPPLRQPMSGAFPQRNRLISGMSLGVIVVEAAERSGALISARHAMEQGREVFAVPGRIDSRVSRGCHQLIRDGAKLVESIHDVIDELGPFCHAIPAPDQRLLYHPAELSLNPQEQTVLAQIGTEPTSIDDVVASTGLPVAQVLSTISVLEMSQLIRRVSGNQVTRRC